jgi:hypothetical protein
MNTKNIGIGSVVSAIALNLLMVATPVRANIIVCKDGEQPCKIIITLPDVIFECKPGLTELPSDYSPPNCGGPDTGGHGSGTRFANTTINQVTTKNRGTGRLS